MSPTCRPIYYSYHMHACRKLTYHTQTSVRSQVWNNTQASGSFSPCAFAYYDLHCYWCSVVLYECQCVTMHICSSLSLSLYRSCFLYPFSPLVSFVPLPRPSPGLPTRHHPLLISAPTCSFFPLRVSQPISITPRIVSRRERGMAGVREGGSEGGRERWWIKRRLDGQRNRGITTEKGLTERGRENDWQRSELEDEEKRGGGWDGRRVKESITGLKERQMNR